MSIARKTNVLFFADFALKLYKLSELFKFSFGFSTEFSTTPAKSVGWGVGC